MLLSFSPALALGMEGWQEVLELRSRFDYVPEEFISVLNAKLPEGVTVLKLEKIDPDSPRLHKKLASLLYSLSWEDTAFQRVVQADIPQNDTDSITRWVEKRIEAGGTQGVDPKVYRVWSDHTNRKVYFSIRLDMGKAPRVQGLVTNIFGIEHPAFHIVREKIVLEHQDST
jgi:hypothetical protein